MRFTPIASRLDEEKAKAGLDGAGFGARDMAQLLAEMKAREVADPGEALVLGADQVLESEEGEIFGKPGSREEARDQLRRLSGRLHRLHSAAAVVEQGETVWSQSETAHLTMRELSDAFLDDYLEREFAEVAGNVGAYRIEGLGAQLFDEVDGSHFAVLGLPLLPLLDYLRRRGLLQA
ncbi:MAG: Maf family protein [Sphingosinicella sp.]